MHACSWRLRSGARDTALLEGQLQWHREQLAAAQAALQAKEGSVRSAQDRAREWQGRAQRAERDNKQLQNLLRHVPLLASESIHAFISLVSEGAVHAHGILGCSQRCHLESH